MPEEEKQDQSSAPQGPVSPTGGGGAVRLSPTGGVGPTGGGTSGGTPSLTGTTPTPAAGGQFASLNQYLAANQGQATPLANKVTGGIQNQYNNLSTGNTSTLGGINQQISAAATPTQDQTNAIIAQESANPVSFSSNPGNVASFQNLLNTSYGGPASAESTNNYQSQQNAINSAISAGQNATNTEAGRENLLAQNEATPTTGVTALNSAILSQSPTALNSIEQAYQPFNGLLTNLKQGATTTDQQIAQNVANAENANAASNAAITGQINALNTGVANELSTAQKNAANQASALQADLAAGTPTTTDLAALGMTPAQWNTLSAADKAAATSQVVNSANGQFGANTGTTNIDLSQFLASQNPNLALTAANVATPQQYQQAQAFQTLLNGLNLGTPATTINPATATQAGTAPTNLNTFDYQTALNTAQTAQASEQAAAQAYVNAIQAGADEQHAQDAAKQAATKAEAMGALTSTTGVGNAGAAGMGQGIYNSIAGDVNNPSLAHTADIFNSILGPKAVVNTVKGIEQGVTGAVNTISQIFCFHPDTFIEMADGRLRRICDVKIGDNTRGGKVLATTRGIAQTFYWYNGVLVTGKHAVKEDGVWVRVENSKRGQQFKYLTEVVCNLVTEKHRIWANNIEFADEYETDQYESLNLDESLAEMNKNDQSLA